MFFLRDSRGTVIEVLVLEHIEHLDLKRNAVRMISRSGGLCCNANAVRARDWY